MFIFSYFYTLIQCFKTVINTTNYNCNQAVWRHMRRGSTCTTKVTSHSFLQLPTYRLVVFMLAKSRKNKKGSFSTSNIFL